MSVNAYVPRPAALGTTRWALRRDYLGPMVANHDNDAGLSLLMRDSGRGGTSWQFDLSRADARLLARRLLQALDSTKGRR